MKLIRSLPGPVLVFLGAFSLSFGGLIIKSFEGATQWQILFWRTVFFLLVISIYLLITYKKSIFKSFYDSGPPRLFWWINFIFWFLWICICNVQYYCCKHKFYNTKPKQFSLQYLDIFF